ncbi:hypothetical protein K438DRAFT_1761666 [Mycena galopus ATCC 62051]|nr:hypothetical protein K438DRAFT_1761666 [Mycena galopus ATCC 62051]
MSHYRSVTLLQVPQSTKKYYIGLMNHRANNEERPISHKASVVFRNYPNNATECENLPLYSYETTVGSNLFIDHEPRTRAELKCAEIGEQAARELEPRKISSSREIRGFGMRMNTTLQWAHREHDGINRSNTKLNKHWIDNSSLSYEEKQNSNRNTPDISVQKVNKVRYESHLKDLTEWAALKPSVTTARLQRMHDSCRASTGAAFVKTTGRLTDTARARALAELEAMDVEGGDNGAGNDHENEDDE